MRPSRTRSGRSDPATMHGNLHEPGIFTRPNIHNRAHRAH